VPAVQSNERTSPVDQSRMKELARQVSEEVRRSGPAADCAVKKTYVHCALSVFFCQTADGKECIRALDRAGYGVWERVNKENAWYKADANAWTVFKSMHPKGNTRMKLWGNAIPLTDGSNAVSRM
jgi:hypothetical protein